MRTPSLDRTAFLASLLVFAWLYGFATSARGWFPNDLLVLAWKQGQALFADPAEWTLIPRVYERSGVRVLEPAAIQPGPTLVATQLRELDWAPGLELVDRDGTVLHRWHVDPEALFPDSIPIRRTNAVHASINGSYLFPNGDVVVNLYYLGSVRLDACGELVWRMTEGNHHSVARDDGGNFWIPGISERGPAVTPAHPDGLPGIEDEVFQELILQITPDGEVLRSINVFDLLYANGLERYIRKASWRPDEGDVLHLNDVEPLPAAMADEYPLFEAGDLVVSLRFLDLVFVFDPDDGRVKWHATDPFHQQHDPDFMGGGWIGVFDNNHDGTDRGTMLGGSRVVALQPHTDSVRTLYPTPASEPFYTDAVGEWQRLPNGNLLLAETRAGRVVEAAPDGRTVWDWVVAPNEEGEIPEIADAARYDLTKEQVADWPCGAAR